MPLRGRPRGTALSAGRPRQPPDRGNPGTGVGGGAESGGKRAVALETARERRPDPPPPSFFAGSAARWSGSGTRRRQPTATASACLPAWSRKSPSRWTGKARLKLSFTGGAAGRTLFRSSASRAGRSARDDLDTVELVRRLARFYPDGQIAGILNDQGRRSAQGLPFSTSLVHKLRYRHGVPGYRRRRRRGRRASERAGGSAAA